MFRGLGGVSSPTPGNPPFYPSRCRLVPVTVNARPDRGQVIGIRQQDNWRLTGPGVEVCNAEDRERLEWLFDHYQFAAVLDCAGNCALTSCE